RRFEMSESNNGKTILPDINEVMLALVKFGMGAKGQDDTVILDLLTLKRNRFQECMAYYYYYTKHGTAPINQEELEKGFTYLNEVQEKLRDSITKDILNRYRDIDKDPVQYQAALDEIAKRHKEAQKPHELG